MKPRLTLTFDADYGRKYSICIDLDEHTAREIEKVSPPLDIPGAVSFETCIQIMKIREFRKSLFVQTSRNLGQQLAERMEDAEGWHDISRIEPAKRQLEI